MGLKTNSSFVDAQLSKMEAAIENIASLPAADNLTVNQLMERKAAIVITAKVAFVVDPKWTTVMAKNVRQVISRAVETLVDTPKQKERKLNPRLMSFKAKEGEIEKEPVQWLNIELLQGQMRLCAKVVATMWQQVAIVWAYALAVGTRPNTVLLKFAMN
jgi:hypothetical protein